jgi:pimeloyl-ACP methyl ester carboxylesterase
VTEAGDNVEPARNAAHEVARKIKPQYADGELVKVGWAANQAEGELIQGMLLEEGIPSALRRARGFDVPDFLAAGPRDVLVPISGAERARELLDPPGSQPSKQAGADQPLLRAVIITICVLAAAGTVAGLTWLALQSTP